MPDDRSRSHVVGMLRRFCHAGGACRLLVATLIFADSQATLHHMDWKNRITIDPEKRGGKPCIRSLRMTV